MLSNNIAFKGRRTDWQFLDNNVDDCRQSSCISRIDDTHKKCIGLFLSWFSPSVIGGIQEEACKCRLDARHVRPPSSLPSISFEKWDEGVLPVCATSIFRGFQSLIQIELYTLPECLILLHGSRVYGAFLIEKIDSGQKSTKHRTYLCWITFQNLHHHAGPIY